MCYTSLHTVRTAHGAATVTVNKCGGYIMFKWIQSLFDRAVREEPLVLNTPVVETKAKPKPRAKAKTKTVKATPSKTTRKKK